MNPIDRLIQASSPQEFSAAAASEFNLDGVNEEKVTDLCNRIMDVRSLKHDDIQNLNRVVSILKNSENAQFRKDAEFIDVLLREKFPASFDVKAPASVAIKAPVAKPNAGVDSFNKVFSAKTVQEFEAASKGFSPLINVSPSERNGMMVKLTERVAHFAALGASEESLDSIVNSFASSQVPFFRNFANELDSAIGKARNPVGSVADNPAPAASPAAPSAVSPAASSPAASVASVASPVVPPVAPPAASPAASPPRRSFFQSLFSAPARFFRWIGSLFRT